MPRSYARYASFDDHIENDPFVFLPVMVRRINRLLEILPSIDIERYASNKLYSPLVLLGGEMKCARPEFVEWINDNRSMHICVFLRPILPLPPCRYDHRGRH